MLNPAHMLEIALLLLLAFLVGAVVGSLARLAIARVVPAKAAVPLPVATTAEPPKPAETPALVEAPVIAEVTRTPTPTAPAEVPAPDFTEALLALAGDKPGSLASTIRMPSIAPLPAVAVTKPAEAMGPARVAGETTSGGVVAHPRSSAEPARVFALGPGAEVIPFPLERVAVENPEPPVVVVATPMASVEPTPAVAAAEEAEKPEAEIAAEPVAELEPVLPVEAEARSNAVMAVDVASIPIEQLPSANAEAVAAATVSAEELPSTGAEFAETEALPDLAATTPEPDVVPQRSAEGPESAETEASHELTATMLEPVIAPQRSAEDDEAAAMRAIEGSWSPRRTASPRPRRVDLPEMSAEAAVLASATAVASATEAANLATIAEPDAVPGKPIGIPAPRLGVKDDLTHVIGILPIIETALNTLGIYHFDQVSDLTDENVGWIENHLGIAGRISREHWREQARELAVAMAGTKKAAGQQ